MFVLKRGDNYMRYLGGRLADSKDHPETGYFIVLAATWTKSLQDAYTFTPRYVAFNKDTHCFISNVREKYGMDVEIVNVQLVEV